MSVDYTFSPTNQPDWGLDRAYKPRTLQAEFGDGYAQRAGDGINANPVEFSAVWTNATEAEKTYIDDFFKARGGYQSFYFTDEDEGSASSYNCKEWAVRHTDSDGYVITAKFREVFDL